MGETTKKVAIGTFKARNTLSAASVNVTTPHTIVSRRMNDRNQGDAALRRNSTLVSGHWPATKWPVK
jgi:hypothetical protein